jgi:hypothetical protein
MKKKHTIVDKWPLSLKRGPNEKGGKKEFRILLASVLPAHQRYVEWKRMK